METIDNNSEVPGLDLPIHEQVYRALRQKVLTGQLLPDKQVTLRGLADMLEVSQTPVREAVRRLIAERALEMHDNRRVSVARMTDDKFQDIRLIRLLLEPEMAERAAKKIKKSGIKHLASLDDIIDECIEIGDVERYLEYNYKFHFYIYDASDSKFLRDTTESVWLQLAPFMRVCLGRYGTSFLVDHHRETLSALQEGNPSAFRKALASDIEQGMDLILQASSRRSFA